MSRVPPSICSSLFADDIAICPTIGGVVGLVGGIRVYQKWNGGERDIQKEIVGWAGSCIFLLLVGTALKTFYGI